jgi:hypothetical protein
MDELFLTTRESLHRVGEHVLAAARYAAIRRIGLQVVDGGFSTGPFGGEGTVVSVHGDRLVVEDVVGQRSARLTTLREAAELARIRPGAPAEVYRPATDGDPDRPLDFDVEQATRITDWYRTVARALSDFTASLVDSADAAAQQTLWPEHFDVAIRVDGVNYGGLAGDDAIAEPYVYVGPDVGGLAGTDDPFWNQPFGAVRTWTDVDSAADIAAFFSEGRHRALALRSAAQKV